MLREAMTPARMVRRGIVLALVGFLLAGCASWRELFGLPAQSDPSVQIRSAEPKWLLIKNPRFGDVASEPEYIWVEEDKVPTTLKSLVLGKGSLIAPPEVVARYGSPPGGGRISPRQKLPPGVEPGRSPSAVGVASAAASRPDATPVSPPRGFVVFVDTSRIVIDLTAEDGVRPGTLVSLRRDKIPIVHPITGELLGELDEEIATGRVTEVREKFSVIELYSLGQGSEIKVKDRVVVR